ncbi:MAG: serine/threonine protein kinase [Eubacterium sp.]|nr:serine/threonine protein kinase [Eubacterium sp.]
MSEIYDYITAALQEEYTKQRTLTKTAVNELTLYRHDRTGQQLVLICSGYRNDAVFRRLKGLDTNGYTPRIYEVAGEEEHLYVLEEYVDGTPLSDYIPHDGQPETDTVRSVLIDLCTALEILHGLDIVHRDIKPENVLLRDDGKACLIDFSIAKVTVDTEDTQSLGTAGYAAPEQYGVSGSQPTTDIYALGVLANVLLTGEHPTARIPKGKLGKIIKKCTDIQISRRYQSATALKQALLRI